MYENTQDQARHEYDSMVQNDLREERLSEQYDNPRD
jgi:hypothetical protein